MIRKSAIVLLLLVLSFALGAHPVEASVGVNFVREGEWIINFEAPHSLEVLENINRGLTAEILFEIRVYQNYFSFVGLRGGNLIQTHRVSLQGRWDLFNRTYVIVRNGKIERYTTAGEFLDQFFSLREYSLQVPPGRPEEDRVLLVRGRVVPVRLHPPFRILVPLQNFFSERAHWSETSLERGR